MAMFFVNIIEAQIKDAGISYIFVQIYMLHLLIFCTLGDITEENVSQMFQMFVFVLCTNLYFPK